MQLNYNIYRKNSLDAYEKEILRLLLNYGDRTLEFEDYKGKVSNYIIEELEHDNIIFSNTFYKNLLEEYSKLISDKKIDIKKFLNHQDKKIQDLAIDLVSKKHEISKKWEDLHQIFIGDETKNMEKTIEKAILSLKQAYLKSKIANVNLQFSEGEDPDKELINKLTKLNKALVIINKLLGRNFN